jgi:hypothetical protein
MKNKIILILLAIVTLSGCVEKTKPEEILGQKFPEKVTISELRALLPNHLTSAGVEYAIYVDEQKKEHRLKIEVSPKIQEQTLSGKTYQAEVLEVNFALVLKNVRTRLTLDTKLIGSVDSFTADQSMHIEPADGLYPLFGIDVYYNYRTRSMVTLSAPKVEFVNLLGKTFRDVYAPTQTNIFQYQSLRFNFEIGLVSFADAEKNLYVFDRFE